MNSSQPITFPRRLRWLAPVVLTAAVLATFGKLAGADFTNWDDKSNITENLLLLWPQPNSLRWVATATNMDIYMPLTRGLWLLLCWIQMIGRSEPFGPGELSATPFHLLNILVHLAATWAVYRLIVHLTRNAPAALVGALAFAVHPIQVEAVGWVSGLKDLLAGLFTVTALWFYTVYRQAAPASPRWRWFAASCVALLLAMAGKPSAMTALPLAIALDRLHFRTPWITLLRDLAIWALIIAPFAITARIIQTGFYAQPGPLHLRPLMVTDSLAFYLLQIVLPSGFTFDYGRRPQVIIETGLLFWTWIIPAFLMLVCLLLRRRINLWLPVAIFVLAACHTLGLVPFDFQFYSNVADHYAYVMMVGIGLGVAVALSKFNHRAAYGVAGALVVLWMALSFRQVDTWRNNAALMGHALSINPNNIAANLYTSQELYKAGKIEEAARVMERNTAYEPNYYLTQLYLANVYMDLKRYDLAQERFDAGLSIIVANTGPDSGLTDETLRVILRRCAKDRQPDMIRHYAAIGLKLKGQPLVPGAATQPH